MMKGGNTQTQDGFDTDDGDAKEKTHWRCNHIFVSVYRFSFIIFFYFFITDRLSFCMLFGKPIVHVLQIIVLSNKNVNQKHKMSG